MDQNDWERSKGEICSRCGTCSLKVINGLCTDCCMREVAKREKKMELKSRVRQLSSIFRDRRLAGKRK